MEFKQPIRLEENAERLCREAADLENNLDDLVDIEADNMMEALDQLMEIERREAKVMFLKEIFAFLKKNIYFYHNY